MHGTLPHKLKEMPTDEYMRLISVMNFERQMATAPVVLNGDAPPDFDMETITEEVSL